MRFKKHSVGRLRIHEEKPSVELATPLALKYEGFEDAEHGVEVIRDGEMLRQVKSPQVLADIVVINARKYEVRFYNNPGVFRDGLYHPQARDLRSTTVIENPDSRVFNRLKVTRKNGEKSREAVYAWHQETSEWALESGGGLKRESLKRGTQDIAKVDTRQITDARGNLVKKTIRRVEEVLGKYSKVEDIEDPDGAQLRKTVLYDAEGKLVQEIHPDGAWEYYQYNDKRQKWRVFSSYLNQDPTTDPALCRMTEYSYQAVGGKDDGSVRSAYPRCVVEYLKGQEIRRTYYVISAGEEQQIQCQTPGAAWDAPDNLVTITRKYIDGPFKDELKSVFYPDGTIELHAFEISVDGQRRTATVYKGQSNTDQTGVVKGTKTVTVIGIGSETIRRQVTDVASGLVIEQEDHSTVKDDTRAHRVDYLDGTHETRTYGCCGQVEAEVDRQGVETSYAYDDLDRVIATSRNGITEIATLDTMGRILARVRQADDGSQIVLERNTYDMAGRQIASVNAQGGQTLIAHSTDAQGQNLITTTYADGGQMSATYARDGRLIKMTGNAAKPVRYAWDVEADEGVGREMSAIVKLDGNGNDTSEWVRMYQDMLGRPYKQVYSDGVFDQTFYNQKGQIWKRQDPDGIVTLSQYNDLGVLEYAAMDMDRNGRIDLNGSDRVTRILRDYVTSHGATVRRTRTFAWPDDKKDLPVLVSSEEQTLDGRNTWSTRNGLITHTETVMDGQGNSTITVTNPDQTRTITQYHNDQATSVVHFDAKGTPLGQTTFEYDAYNRRTASIDDRNGKTSYDYSQADQVIRVTTSAPADGEAPQTTVTEYDAMGRPVKITQPDGASVFKEYYPSSQLKRMYGARTYPVEYTYDAQGRMKTMTTYQDYAKRQGAAVTAWNYDPQRGWLMNKRYADGQGPEYEYYASGKIKIRKWARGIVTTYGYTPSGELAEVSYSDTTTPKVRYTYDRQGRRTGVAQILGTNRSVGSSAQPETKVLASAYEYNALGQLLTETYTAGPLAGVTIANSYDTLGRRTALAASHASRITSHAFTYDDASRLKTVSDGENTATYDYLANSPLWGQISFEHNGVKQMITTRQFDRLNRLKSISSSGGASSESPIISAFDYQYNQANQRVKAALEDESHWDYTYDSLGQLTSGKKQRSNHTPEPDQDFEYTHDDIGNRITTGGHESSRAQYAANALNQCTRRDDLQTAGKTTGFQYDADGNLVGDDQWIYTWDAENRLMGMESATGITAGQRKRLEFAYDSQGRRIGKKVYELQGNRWSPITELRFVYDGWNLLAELSTDHRPLSTYLWGLDLSGSLQKAGGVGGLLMATERGGSVSQRYMAYDGNGNVVALIDAQTGNALARFRYDPFGNDLESSNHRSIRNPFRFSTKYQDEETGFLYYGYRYYQPRVGRWSSRDPIGEEGGPSLFGFVYNDPLSKFDIDGRICICKSLKFWLRDGAPLSVWDTMTIGEQVEQRNGVDVGTGRVRHCVAACLLKRHFYTIYRHLWDYFYEDPANEDSQRDMQAEDIGEGFACTVNDTCEAACVGYFGQNPQ
jgi:RHS repeat-associated protein